MPGKTSKNAEFNRFRPSIESLEDRWMPSNTIVNSVPVPLAAASAIVQPAATAAIEAPTQTPVAGKPWQFRHEFQSKMPDKAQAQPSSFTVVIEWGDGSSTKATVLPNDSGSGLPFVALATHTYANPGQYPLSFSIMEPARLQGVADYFGFYASPIVVAASPVPPPSSPVSPAPVRTYGTALLGEGWQQKALTAAARMDQLATDFQNHALAASDQFFAGVAEWARDTLRFLAQERGVPTQQLGGAIAKYMTSNAYGNNAQLYAGAIEAVRQMQRNPARFWGKNLVNVLLTGVGVGGALQRARALATELTEAENVAASLENLRNAEKEAAAAGARETAPGTQPGIVLKSSATVAKFSEAVQADAGLRAEVASALGVPEAELVNGGLQTILDSVGAVRAGNAWESFIIQIENAVDLNRIRRNFPVVDAILPNARFASIANPGGTSYLIKKFNAGLGFGKGAEYRLNTALSELTKATGVSIDRGKFLRRFEILVPETENATGAVAGYRAWIDARYQATGGNFTHWLGRENYDALKWAFGTDQAILEGLKNFVRIAGQ